MGDGLQGLIPSASPIASQGIDYDELLASGDPTGYMAAKRAGLEYKAPNVTLAPQPAAQSALAAGAGKPQESVAPASQPAPAAGTSTDQNGLPDFGQTTAPTGMRPDLDNFGSNLASQGQMPATNVPNPQTDTTGAPSVPGNISPAGTFTAKGNPVSPNTVQEGVPSQMAAAAAGSTTPTAPGATPPVDVNSIEARLAAANSPQSPTNPKGVPNPRDPDDPDNKEGYRPTKWQRFGRGVLGGLEGLAQHGLAGALMGAVDPAAVGATAYGAPTRKFSDTARLNAGLQANLQQQLTQGATNAETALKQAQAQGAQLIEITPQIAQEIGNIGLSGERVSQATFQHLVTNSQTVQGKKDVADTTVQGKKDVQAQKDAAMQDLRTAQEEEANAKAELARAGNDPNSPAYKLALKKANTASANASAAAIRANAYALNANAGNLGIDNQGNQIQGGATTAEGKPIGSRFAAPYIKQEGKTAQFNDVLGATDNIELTAQRLVQKGGKLNSPAVAAAIADPKSTSAQWAQGEFATSNLNPEERDYVTNVKAYKENLQALRQSAGGGVSDAQVNRLMEMAPGASTPDLDFLKRQTGQIRLTANRLAEGLPQMKGGHAVRGGSTSTNGAGPIQPGEKTAVGPGGHTIVVRGGKWVDPTSGKAVQ